MQANHTESVMVSPNHRPATYTKVCDRRKQPIRGLWKRNGGYYAQLTIEEQITGRKRVRRVRLEGAGTDAQAVAKFHELLTQRQKGSLPVLKRTPTFEQCARQYFDFYDKVKDAKRQVTLEGERYIIAHWIEHLGHVRVDRITRALINSYIAQRQAAGRTGRTVNLDVTCFRNVLKRAMEDGWITALPTQGMKPLKWTPPKRELFSEVQINELCAAAERTSKNGREFADYLRLLAYCGARMSEALRLKWADVDWEPKQLTIGADGLSKNRKNRVVDFNPKLEAHLKDMQARRAPDTQWLFPSPQRGNVDRPAKTFRETLILARNAAELPKFGFHDCRHFFISYCVMSGIDYMTIALWVGHRDGGILIGKVYGHLSNEHAQAQAQRLRFGPELAVAAN